MDVLEPRLVWVEGRCYRFPDNAVWSREDRDLGAYQEDTYEPDYALNEDDLMCGEDLIEIEPVKGNRFKHSFYVNSYFFKFIIGSKGLTKKRVENETKTAITIPKIGEKGHVVIMGARRRDVITARHRLDILIETSRSKLEFTHFISIPCNFEKMKQNFYKFKDEVIKKYGKGPRAIKENTFQKPEKLHLTVIMLVLLDEEDRRKAMESLQKCQENIIENALKKGPLMIELKGIEIMNDDPSEVEVLYIKAQDDSGRLQDLSDQIADYFVQQELTRKQYDNVKLHLTVMNTSFLRTKDERNTQNYGNKETFDASGILKEYSDYYFGTMQLSEIHLSQRHKQDKNGYYAATSTINF